jgi:AcrR family transcriptional regulator
MSFEKLNTRVRRQQIAQEALKLVDSHGLKGLSMAGVARRSGLVPSGIYRHFKSKDEVLDGVLTLIHDRLFGNVNAVCEETQDPMERLRRLLVRHVQLIRENRAIPRVLFSEDVYGGHPQRKERVYGMISGYLNRVQEIVRQGQREGRIRKDLDPATVSLMFLGMIQSAAILWHLSDGRFDVTRHAKRAWKIVSDFIEKPHVLSKQRKPKSPVARRGRLRNQGVM